MRKIILSLIIVMALTVVLGAKIVPVPQLMKPQSLSYGSGNFYIGEGPTIHIYSAKDFSHLKTFGKRGEGPGEFKVSPTGKVGIHPLEEEIFVSTRGKVSYFSPEGVFIKERRTITGGDLHPLGKGFVSVGGTNDKKIDYLSIDLHGPDLKKVKQVIQFEAAYQGGLQQLRFFAPPESYVVYKDKIYVAGRKDMVIHVYNSRGEKLPSISTEYRRIPVTSEAKETAQNWFKNAPNYKEVYHHFKKWMTFPGTYPAIRDYSISGDKLYLLTHNKKNGAAEFYIFTLEGQLIGQAFMPFAEHPDPLRTLPYTIHQKTLYQLVENSAKEQWEVRIHKFHF